LASLGNEKEMSYLNDLVKVTGNEYASIVEEGVGTGDVTHFIDTGSYALNALVSGSLHGGFAGNKITAIAGEQATGKTFFLLGMVRNFLESNPNAGVLYFESESAISKLMIEQRGIDSSRMVIIPVTTIQEFRNQCIKIIDKHLEIPKEDRPPLVICLDSLGMLSTQKEVEDIAAGKDTRDMTRAQLIRGAFRVLTLKAGAAGIPIFMTNHTYEVVGAYVPTKEMGGGAGLKFAASNILFLTKKKFKDGTEQVGNIVTCRNYKSRLTVENKKVESLITFNGGLSRWHGMIDFAINYGLWTMSGSRVDVGDKKVYAKDIMKNPETYFTEDVMSKIEEKVAEEFKYGTLEPLPESNEETAQDEFNSASDPNGT
tara:strand:- start:514 stop:1626 length:1113 start_codon:yes stop_codon:yes gene_type:complete